mgnify:FL=1
MISVCMATYNGERFIKEQIDSILPQLSQDDELIISDDGSTDRTLEIIASYKDERIKVFHHKKTGNKYYPTLKICYSTSNFENALNHAKGDYIFLSDQDDIWEKNKVLESLELLKKYDYVIHNFSVIDGKGNVIKSKFYNKPSLKFKIPSDVIRPNFWGCCSCFNRKVLEKSLPFPEKICLHDFWIGLVAEKFGKCFWNDSCLIRHRISEQNTSSGGRKSENSLLLKIRYRLNTLLELGKITRRKTK